MLHLLNERDAEGSTKTIFEDIKRSLGVPYVNTMFQALASHPRFFELFWNTAKPALYTQEFFICAERLGAEAYTRMANYFSVPDLRDGTAATDFGNREQPELQEAVELYDYNYSVLLLLSAALVHAFEHPDAHVREGTPVAIDSRYLKKPVLIEENVAPIKTRRIYEDIKRTLHIPFINICYMDFARWPDFLSSYWESLKPLLKTPLYEHNRLALRDSALSMASSLPKPLRLATSEMEEAGLSAPDIDSVIQLSELFLNQVSKQALNMSFARIGLEEKVLMEMAA